MAHLESGHFAFILAHELSSSNAGSSIMCNGGFVFHSSRYSFMNACSGPLPRKSKPAEVNGVSSIWLNTSGVVQVISRYKTPGKPFVLRFTLILTPRRPATCETEATIASGQRKLASACFMALEPADAACKHAPRSFLFASKAECSLLFSSGVRSPLVPSKDVSILDDQVPTVGTLQLLSQMRT